MRKIKRIISLFMLMIIFLSSIRNIVFGAMPIDSAKLILGDSIKTNVEYNDGVNTPYELKANYIYYIDEKGDEHPAYCISFRKRWN